MSSPLSLRRLLIPLLALLTGFMAAVYLQSRGYLGDTVHVATLADGAEYTGTLRDGRLHGRGTMTWPYGARYEGEFRDGLFHGKGVFEDGLGNRYEGDFAGGLFTGRGTIHYEGGDVYEGETRDWRPAGRGIFRIGESEYRGSFEDEALTGSGEYYEDGELVYRGEFRDWVYHGEGELFRADGRYAGEFEEGYLVSGTFESDEGVRYEGGFSWGAYDGEGVLILASSDRYEGEFRRGDFHGRGTMHLAERQHGVDSYSGTWRDGRLVASDQSAFVEDYEAAVERALYSEDALLAATLDAVQRGDPERREVYFLGIAGDGTQRVFSREIAAFGAFLDEIAPLAGREVRLVNDRDAIGERPMATRTSIRRALQVLGRRMDREQDLLVLYASSHGSAEHELLLKNRSIGLADLPAQELAGMLRDSGIRWQAVFVSACYSGGFIDPLRSDYNFVMTAAAADKTSFGCADEADSTYFGGALLESLRQGGGLADVFARVREAVDSRESEKDLEASEPQLHLGEAMAAQLAQGTFALFP